MMDKQEAFYALVPYLMCIHDMRQDMAMQAAEHLWYDTDPRIGLPQPQELATWLADNNYIQLACDIK